MLISAAAFQNDYRNIETESFLANLKNAVVTPTFKKEDRLLKSNYRPVSILATLSEVYEKLTYPHIQEYFNVIFSNYLGGFRKGHSIQHSLIYMLKKLKEALDKGYCSQTKVKHLTVYHMAY